MSQTEYLAKVSALGSTAYWALDEASGDLADASGNGFTLTEVGSVGSALYQQAGPFDGSFSLYLDGTSAFNYTAVDSSALPIPSVSNAYLAEYTGVIWVNFDAVAATQVLLRQSSSNAQTNFNLVQDSTDELRSDEFYPSDRWLREASAFSASTWYMVSMVKANNRRELWVNDTLVANDTSPENNNGVTETNPIDNTLQYFNLGGRYTGSLINGVVGYIAGPAAFNTALEQGDIEALYESAVSASVKTEAKIPAFDPDPTSSLTLEWVARQFRRLSDYLKTNYSFAFDNYQDLSTLEETVDDHITTTTWNAHGNTAVGGQTDPLKIESGSFWIDGVTGDTPTDFATSGDTGHFMWIPSKYALRAGRIEGTNWDATEIGSYSLAIGRNPRAKGNNTICLGRDNIADGAASLCAGRQNNNSNGTNNVLLGFGNSGTVTDAICIGNNNEVDHLSTFGIAFGLNNSSLAAQAITFGNANSVSGLASACFGYSNVIGANSSNSLTIGSFCKVDANTSGSIAIGKGISLVSPMLNDQANTIYMGLSSTVPTFIMTAGDGTPGSTGFIGIVETTPLSTLDISGSVGFKYTNLPVAAETSKTILSTDAEYTFRVDISTNSYTITLPQLGASTVDRRIYYFKATGGGINTLTITPDGADQIEDFTAGAGTLRVAGDGQPISSGDAITIIANNSDGAWWVI